MIRQLHSRCGVGHFLRLSATAFAADHGTADEAKAMLIEG